MFVAPKYIDGYLRETAVKGAFDPATTPKIENDGFVGQLSDAFRYQRFAENSTSEGDAWDSELTQEFSKMETVSPDELSKLNRLRPNKDVFSKIGGLFNLDDQAESDFWREYDALRQNRPELHLRSRTEMKTAIRERGERLRRAFETSDGSFAAGVGNFIGSAAGSLTDPVNLASMLLTGGWASGAVKSLGVAGAKRLGVIAGTEFLTGAATELPIQLASADFKRSLGVEASGKDIAVNTLAAGVGGAALPVAGAGMKKLYGAFRRALRKAGKNAPLKARAAGIKMDGEAFETQTSPFQTPDAGNAIYHQKQIIDAEQKILRGDPFDAGVRQLRYIDEPIADVMGKKPGYLQLKSSNVHPSEKHLKNIRDVGFSSVEDYSDFVARNFDGIYKGSSPGRYMFAVSSERLQQLNVHTNGHSNTLVVEAMLIKDSGIFDVVSAFPCRIEYLKNKKNLLSERAQTNQTVSDSPGAYFGQKQALNNNITFDGRNVQPVKVDGYKITTQYDIVDLSELKTSDFPDYPAALQPRDRSRQASADQVGEMMRRLDPERLGRHTDADRGAPIVSPDGFVESGNGRTAAIRRAYEENPQSAARYRAMVEAEARLLGKDVSGMKRPVLIRRRLTDLSEEERRAFVVAANRSSSLGYSVAETAVLDAEKMTADMLDLLRDGDLRSVSNSDFVREFRRRAVPKEDAAGFQKSDGTLSASGERRIAAALFYRAYNDRDLAEMLFDAQSNIKTIGTALQKAAPDVARLRDAVAEGIIPAQYDISADIVAAANLVRSARDAGEKVADRIAQTDIFKGELPENTLNVLRLFFHDEHFSRPVSAEKIADALKKYVDSAMRERTDQSVLFDMEKKTPSRILETQYRNDLPDAAETSTDAKAATELTRDLQTEEIKRLDADLDAALRDLPDVPDIRAEIEEAKSGDGLIAEVSSCIFGG